MRRNYLAMMALIAPLLLSTLVVKVGGTAGAPRQEFSNTCEFREGPRRGQRQQYPDQPALPVGTPCWDGQGSRGLVVSERGVPGPPGGRAETSNTCEFREGSRRGQRQRYPGQPPLPVGSPCHDGRGSKGVVVSEGATTTPPGDASAAMSRACYFVLGPKAGKTEVFPGKPAATVGGPCNDGVASRGIVAVEGAPAVGQFGLPDGQPACKDIVRAAVPYRLNEMIPKSGLATFDQSGPVIFLRGSQLPTFSPPVRTFLVAHECGHHALGQVRAALLYRLPIGPEGELAADCFAMSEMKRLNLLDAERVGVIMNFLATVPGDPTTYDGPERMRRLRQCSVP